MPSDRILRAVESQPWALHPPKLDQILAVLEAKANTGQIPEASDIEAAERRQRRAVQSSGSVAVLPLFGTISQRMGMLDAMSGGASLEAFGDAFDELMANDDVSTIVLQVDSPGGSVFGVQEAAEKIYAARGRKRVIAVADSLAASAAYWLAAAAEEFVVTPSGQVGSVGVYMVHFDMSEAMDEAGVKATVIRAGANKAEALPYTSLSEDTVAHLQGQVDDYGIAFVEAVARFRGMSADAVLEDFGQGRTYTAKRALRRGMVDRIATLEQVVGELVEGPGRREARRLALHAQEGRLAATTEFFVPAGATTGYTTTANTDAHDLKATLGTIERMGAALNRITEHPDTPTLASVGQAAPDQTSDPTDMAPEAKGDTMSNTDTAAQPGAAETQIGDALANERERIRQINALADEHNLDRTQVSAWISDGTSLDAVRAEVLKQLRTKAEGAASVRASVDAPRFTQDPRKGFRNHRDFLMSVLEHRGARSKAGVKDERLQYLAVHDSDDRMGGGELAFMLPAAFTPGTGIQAAAGSDEQGGYADRYGGFSVPTSMAPGMLQIGMEGDPTAGRTQSVPMATPQVDIVARTDKDHSSSVSGGFTVTRKPETVSASSSRMEIEKVSLKASSLFGLAFATEEILTDSPISFAAIIASGFRDQFAFHMLDEKLRGNGGTEFMGVLNAPAKIAVAKESGQSADTIQAENAINMRARAWGYGDSIWIANHDTYPQLIQAAVVVEGSVGGGLVLIYKQSMEEDRPDTLLGRPIFYSEHASTLGDEGDLMLVNWSQYLEGIYQPLQSDESIHVRFVEHERAFKFWLRNAGAPWWRSALTPNQSSDTLSPIVTLAERA